MLCGRRGPRPLPRRTGRRGGGGAARSSGPGGGGRGRGGRGFPHLPAATRGPGTPRAGRGMGACRDSPFVPRGVGRSSGRGLCPRSAGTGTGGSKPGRPLPGLARRSYRGPSAAASCSGRSASLLARARAAAAAARRAPGTRERSEPGAAGARSRSGRGRLGRGRPFILLGVAAAAQPELGERLGEGRAGREGRRAGVGLQAVTHRPLPPHAHPSRPAGRGMAARATRSAPKGAP